MAGKQPDKHGRLPQLREPELELVDLIINTWVEKPGFPVSPDTAGELVKRISPWLGDEEFFQEAAASFAGMPVINLSSGIPESLFLALVFDSGGIEKTGGDVTLPGVKLIPMMRARGLTCRAMVLMGLSSGVFPRKAEEDYFLGDATRAEVTRRAGDLGHRYRSRLPVKSRLTEEMMLLFYLLNTSAEVIHWVIPETDGEGRLVAPTSWVQSYLQEWGALAPGAPGRIPPGPAEQAQYLMGLDSNKGSCFPPGYAFLLGSDFAKNLFGSGDVPDSWRTHYASGDMGPEFFGVVKSASRLDRKENLRVTRLERLARCPYMFFAEFLLELEALEAQEQPFGLNSMEKGSLLHSCLEKVFRKSEAVIPAIRRFLLKPDEVETIVAAEMRKNPTLRFIPPLFLGAMRAQLTGVILDYLKYAESHDADGWCVEGLEHKFEKPFPRLAGVNVSGTADRIDREKDSGNLRIIDYKSGSKKDVSGRGRNYQVNLGWKAQASLYPWMRGDSEEEFDISFSYIFLGEEDKKEIPVVPRTNAEQLLESLRTILEKGTYVPSGKRVMEDCGFPDSLDPCQYCAYQPMCRKSDPGMMVRACELFKRICRERTEAIRVVSGEKSG